mmetsp:Transcript_15416/g.48619  ORF Transcript_15416/g.48619 Transcript_15416/m.48619 type:complete len:273 (+) Transcript_15416:379-1197(+)
MTPRNPPTLTLILRSMTEPSSTTVERWMPALRFAVLPSGTLQTAEPMVSGALQPLSLQREMLWPVLPSICLTCTFITRALSFGPWLFCFFFGTALSFTGAAWCPFVGRLAIACLITSLNASGRLLAWTAAGTRTLCSSAPLAPGRTFRLMASETFTAPFARVTIIFTSTSALSCHSAGGPIGSCSAQFASWKSCSAPLRACSHSFASSTAVGVVLSTENFSPVVNFAVQKPSQTPQATLMVAPCPFKIELDKSVWFSARTNPFVVRVTTSPT